MTTQPTLPASYEHAIAEVIRLRKALRAFAAAHRAAWPREPYTVPHAGPYTPQSSYHDAVRALLEEADRG